MDTLYLSGNKRGIIKMKKFFIIISLVVILSLGIVINNRKYKVDSELLSIFIDNERVSEFPKKGEALLEH